MARTRHIEKRMNQRGIKASMLAAVEEFGVWNGDKLILNRKGCANARKALETMRRNLIKVEEKGGLVLIQDRGKDITTYALDSYHRL